MPYIRKEDREKLDKGIDLLIEELVSVATVEKRVGPTNYVISRIVLNALDNGEWTYHNISRALSVFRDAETEMRRRLMDNREDKAIGTNGDLEEYRDY